MVRAADRKGWFGRVSCLSVGGRVGAAVLGVRRSRVVGRMLVAADLKIELHRPRAGLRLSGPCRLPRRTAEVSSRGGQWARGLGAPPGCRRRSVRAVEQSRRERGLEAILESRVRCLWVASVKCESC